MNRINSSVSAALLCAAFFTGHANAQFGRLLGPRRPAAAAAAPVPAQPELPEPPPGPKAAGVMRVGIIDASASMGAAGSGTAIGGAVRKEWMRVLTGPTLQSVHLTAVLPSQIEAEAKAKECDFILYSAISQKGQPDAAKHAGLLKSASSMSSMIPMMGMGRGVIGMVASTVATSALNGAVEAASVVKAHADVTLEYQLVGLGATPVAVKNSETVKANQDGQNVITPLVEHAAAAIADEMTRTR